MGDFVGRLIFGHLDQRGLNSIHQMESLLVLTTTMGLSLEVRELMEPPVVRLLRWIRTVVQHLMVQILLALVEAELTTLVIPWKIGQLLSLEKANQVGIQGIERLSKGRLCILNLLTEIPTVLLLMSTLPQMVPWSGQHRHRSIRLIFNDLTFRTMVNGC